MAIKLTSMGITEAEKVSSKTGPKEAILSYLYEVGDPIESQEVLEALNLDDEKGVKVMRSLINSRYIAEV